MPQIPSCVLPAPQLLTAVVVGQGTGSEPSPRLQHAVSTCPRNINWLWGKKYIKKLFVRCLYVL